MGHMKYIVPLLFATVVLADYDVDNANSSVIYTMPPSLSGKSWQTFSVSTQSLSLSISNSTGNYTIPLDASHCFDQNYALGVCGTADNCFIEIPFIGSGIAMYVFNAGFSGVAASFSVDGGAAVPESIDAPPAPTYQVSNVSMYNVQGLPSGNHTIRMTLIDWDGSATSMKFDYAHVNETFVASPPKTSSTSSMTSTPATQTSSQTASVGSSPASHSVDVGGIVGAVLGGLAIFMGIAFGYMFLRKHLRKRKATRRNVSSLDSTNQVNPFVSELSSPTPPSVPHAPQQPFFSQLREEITPLTRSALLLDAHAVGNPLPGPDSTSRSIRSGQSSTALQPLRRPPSQIDDVDLRGYSSASHVADVGSPFSDSQIASRYTLTAEQVDVIRRLRRESVPPETIARVIEGFVSSNHSSDGTDDRRLGRERSFISAAPPPSYQTRDR